VVIACVNDNYERIFNQRGQSGDRIVTEYILQKSSNRRLCTLRWRRSTARRRSWPNIDQFRQLIRDRVQNISICDVAAIPFTSTPLIILRQPARKVSHTVLSGIPATRPTALQKTQLRYRLWPSSKRKCRLSTGECAGNVFPTEKSGANRQTCSSS
jgi:hypothetical protein